MPSTKISKTRKNSHHKKTSKRVQRKRAQSKRVQSKRAQSKRVQRKRAQSKRVQSKRSTRKRYGGKEKTYKTLADIRNAIQSNNKLFMLIGHGASNMFGDKPQYEAAIEDIANKIKTTDGVMDNGEGAALLYFGDSADETKPDVGLAFKLLKKKLPSLKIYMIQIDKAEGWGVPEFVEGVFWHGDYDKQQGASLCVWGGFDREGQPCSNTKQWVYIVEDLKRYHKQTNKGIPGVSTLFVLGGGPITVQEMDKAAQMDIPMVYYPLVRMRMGDEEGKPFVNVDEGPFYKTIGPTLEKAEQLQRDKFNLKMASVKRPSEPGKIKEN